MRYEERPWGSFEVLYASQTQWLKRLTIAPGQSLSLQYHKNRDEVWVTEYTDVWAIIGEKEFELTTSLGYTVPRGTKHRLRNAGQTDAVVVEWATGRPEESDIIRIEDDYGR